MIYLNSKESSVDAIKQFVIANKGKYNVFCALEVGLE